MAEKRTLSSKIAPASNKQLAVNVLASWLIPFLTSFAFFAPDPTTGEFTLAIDKNDFKNIMILVCTPLFPLLISMTVVWDDPLSVVKHFVAYLFGNLVLDLCVLIPMSRMPLADYFVEILSNYLIFCFAQMWFGYTMAISAIPQETLLMSVLLRAPLASLTSYVAISFMFDDKQSNITVPIWYFRTAMVLIANFSVGLNLLKALQQVRDLKREALTKTLQFLGVVVLVDLMLISPAFKWSTDQYFKERGFRLLNTMALGIVARSVGVQREEKLKKE